MGLLGSAVVHFVVIIPTFELFLMLSLAGNPCAFVQLDRYIFIPRPEFWVRNAFYCWDVCGRREVAGSVALGSQKPKSSRGVACIASSYWFLRVAFLYRLRP